MGRMQTLDNLLMNGHIDIVGYLERVPKIMEKYRKIDNAAYAGDSVARQKQTAFSQHLDSLGLSDAQRAAVDETYRYWTMFPATPIPYSIETMTDAAQRRWAAAEAWGLTEEEYLRYYPIYSASGEGMKITELVAAGMTQAEAEEFWGIMAASWGRAVEVGRGRGKDRGGKLPLSFYEECTKICKQHIWGTQSCQIIKLSAREFLQFCFFCEKIKDQKTIIGREYTNAGATMAIHIRKVSQNCETHEFDCGNPSINARIQSLYYASLLQEGYGYEIVIDGRIVGYYMITLRMLRGEDIPEEVAEYYSGVYSRPQYAAVEITCLAVQKEFQKQTIGSTVLKGIVKCVRSWCQEIPIRYIMLDALKEYADWYMKKGFFAFASSEPSDPTVKMVIDCIVDQESLERYMERLA